MSAEVDFCPHCGGSLRGEREKPLQHDVFDDIRHDIVIDAARYHLGLSDWRVLAKLRCRIGRFVPSYVLVAEMRHIKDEDDRTCDEKIIHLSIHRIRFALKDAPFFIQNQYGGFYGLFGTGSPPIEK